MERRGDVTSGCEDQLMMTVDQEAVALAEKHYAIEDGLLNIVRLIPQGAGQSEGKEKIALLEVNENTVPTGVMPIEFAPAPASGIHYPSVIVEVTPEEYERIRSAELSLPAGWSLGEAIPRPHAVNGQ